MTGGTLWRNAAVPDRLREEAVREIFARFDVAGPTIVAMHPQPNENAWLLGLAAVRTGTLSTQAEVGLVGARGVERVELISSANVSGLHQSGP